MNREPGQLVFPANFERNIAAPLDATMTVVTLSGLTHSDTFKTLNDGNDYSYVGMFTVVTDDTEKNNGLYILKAQPTTDINNWQKIQNSTSDYLHTQSKDIIGAINEVNKKTSDIVTFSVQVVNSLPTTGKDKVLYLVPDASAAAGTHIEYIWVNGAFEQIGSTAIDLSSYALKTEVAIASATAKSEAISEAGSYTDGKILAVSAVIDSNSGLISGLRTDVNAVSGKADANAAAILTKAEQSAVDSVVADVQTISGVVDTKANADASNVDAADWQAKLGYATSITVNGIDSRLTAAESDIDVVSAVVVQNKSDIATKASNTDLQVVSAVVVQNKSDIATKASSADVTTLSSKVSDNTAAIATKAAQSDLESLSGEIDTKQDALEYYRENITGGFEDVTIGVYNEGGAGLTNVALKGKNLNATFEYDVNINASSINLDGNVMGSAVSTAIPVASSASDYKIASEKAVATAIESIESTISTAYIYKGSKDTYAELPSEGNTIGDVWNVVAANGSIPAGTNYAWNGTAWDALGGLVDLSAYSTTEQMNTAISAAVSPVSTKADANATAINTINTFTIPGIQSDITSVSGDVATLSSSKADVDASNITVATWKSKLGFITSEEVSAYQAQPDWNATTGVKVIANKPDIKKVSISYLDTNDSSGTIYGTYSGYTATFDILNANTYNIKKFMIEPDTFGQWADIVQFNITITTGGGTIQNYTIINKYDGGGGGGNFDVIKEIITGDNSTSFITDITKNAGVISIIMPTNGFTGDFIKIEVILVSAA